MTLFLLTYFALVFVIPIFFLAFLLLELTEHFVNRKWRKL